MNPKRQVSPGCECEEEGDFFLASKTFLLFNGEWLHLNLTPEALKAVSAIILADIHCEHVK